MMSAKQMSAEELFRSLIKAGHCDFHLELAQLPATGRLIFEFQSTRGGRRYRMQVVDDTLYHIPITSPPET